MTNQVDKNNNRWYTRFNPGWFALILSVVAIIFAFGLSSAKIDNTSVKVEGVIATATETRKVVDINSNRLTAIEQFNKTFCNDINEIKNDLKDIRKDQLSFYKSYNKANGKK